MEFSVAVFFVVTRRHNPENSDLNLYRGGNVKSHRRSFMSLWTPIWSRGWIERGSSYSYV